MEYKSRLILSIQSHVAFGYVGNRAACIPLQKLGHEAIIVNTVQLSNHTGYGDFTGDFFSKNHIEDVLKGLEARGLFPQIDAVLTGYMGNPELGEAILNAVKSINTAKQSEGTTQDALYVCDPVMGDTGRGFFVHQDIPAFFKDHAAPVTDILTPNQFEIEYLSGQTITTLNDAKKACEALHQLGTKTILLTSLEHDETPQGHIQMMVSSKAKDDEPPQCFLITTPKVDISPAPNGSGDCTAALFCGYILNGESISSALERTAFGIHGVFENTAKLERRELALIQSQNLFDCDTSPFKAEKLV